jgi:hypothetical protein
MLEELLDLDESRLYLYMVTAGGENGLVGELLAVTCRSTSLTILADGDGGRSEDATDLTPPTLPAALGALAHLSPLGYRSNYVWASIGHFSSLLIHFGAFGAGKMFDDIRLRAFGRR